MVTSADDVPPSQQIIQKVQDAYQVPCFFWITRWHGFGTLPIPDSSSDRFKGNHLKDPNESNNVPMCSGAGPFAERFGITIWFISTACVGMQQPHGAYPLCFRKQIVPSWASVPRAFPWNPRSESVVFCNHKKPLIKLWIDLMSPPGIGFWHSGWHFVYFFLPFSG